MNENQKKAIEVAEKILKLAKNTLLINMRFLDIALFKLPILPAKDTTLSTDGENIYYGVQYIFNKYKESSEIITHDYFHSVLHCIFRHNFMSNTDNRKYWDLATDIAVENVISELNLDCLNTPNQQDKQNEINILKENLKTLNAEKIYRYLIDKNIQNDELERLINIFGADSHDIWYTQKPPTVIGDKASSSKKDNDLESIKEKRYNLQQEWKDISERIQIDMETTSKKFGTRAGSMLQELNELNRERYDYTSFLKKFAVTGETMKINDDEFDYIFYTYGLQLYNNMPLVEPLEYKEVKRIKEFVIAIDTSGSVQGQLVQKFIQKTYNILKSTESFFSKINLYIIQCDTQIQGIAKITSQEDFDNYIKNMVLAGFGGTDFRPVFAYVDNLIKNREFQHLKGIIYFTDGYGIFPDKKPNYDVAFAFLRNEYDNPHVPSWAIKLILEDTEI